MGFRPLAYASPKDPPMDITLQHPDLADWMRLIDEAEADPAGGRSRTCQTAGTAQLEVDYMLNAQARALDPHTVEVPALGRSFQARNMVRGLGPTRGGPTCRVCSCPACSTAPTSSRSATTSRGAPW